MSQQQVLKIIQDNPGIKTKEIQQITGLSKTTVTDQINALRKRKLLKISSCKGSFVFEVSKELK